MLKLNPNMPGDSLIIDLKTEWKRVVQTPGRVIPVELKAISLAGSSENGDVVHPLNNTMQTSARRARSKSGQVETNFRWSHVYMDT
jgi:hypothetical protein